ncbi:hypothetical protein [Natronoglycomyces albus]|uniref:CYTH domain-containing protein n=1 Tax=Natronoglycomyces albus TaxID=2811108 RepID=A0A895XTB7_9ACTN|nr:hypothetical protein [Natronoglycomyces albus]QSB05500.1 hypothetical protein JQS30_00715 [Natronoglycomyces albus]
MKLRSGVDNECQFRISHLSGVASVDLESLKYGALMQRECELKLALERAEVTEWRDRVESLPIPQTDQRREIDFVPDTPGFDFRKAGLLLRCREVRRVGTGPDILVSLKVKRCGGGVVQDNDEYEFLVGDSDSQESFSQMQVIVER